MKFKSILFLFIFTISIQGCESKETISDDTFTKSEEQSKSQVQNDNKEENVEPTKKAKEIIFNLKTHDDKNIKISINNQEWSFKGYENKLIFLDFFGTWCPPCKKSIPHLNSLREKFKNNIEIIGLDIGNRDGTINSSEKLANFIKKYDIKYPVTRGEPNNQIFGGLSSLNPSGSIPFMVLFNEKGQFVKPYIGMVSEEEFEHDIKYLLEQQVKEKKGIK
jgi:thiol-disulfide isomerase/thioredoxin